MKTSKFLPLLIVVALTACGEKTPATTPDLVEASPSASVVVPTAAAPAASVVQPASFVLTAAPSASDLAVGEKIYTSTCLACHGAGVLGAPKFGDKTAWEARIAKGKEVLYTNSLNGFNMMPAKGGNAMLKDEELKAAVDYMVSKAI